MSGLRPAAVRQVDPVPGVEAVMGREAGCDVGEADLGHTGHNSIKSDLRVREGNSPVLIDC